MDPSAALPVFAVLLLAHVLGDFLLQTNAMVRAKRRPTVFGAHGAIHLALMLALLGQWAHPAPYLLALAHLCIDAVKLALPDRLRWFVLDQAAHLATLWAAALLWPGMWAQGAWAPWVPEAPLWALYAAGGLWAVLAGGPAIGLVIAPYRAVWVREQVLSGGLSDAGRRIGELERALAYLLVLTGNATGVGLLIAAKSVLRYGAARDSRALTEYVLIGTLASITWALAAAFTVQGLAPLLGTALAAPAPGA